MNPVDSTSSWSRLDDGWDLHMIDRERYLGISSNIVVRASLRHAWPVAHWQEAVRRWLVHHPYLNARVVGVDGDSEFVLVPASGALLTCGSIGRTSFTQRLTKPSELCWHRFRFRRGPLAKVDVLAASGQTLVELAITHLIGDGMSLLYLFADLLVCLVAGSDNSPLPGEGAPRLIFNPDNIRLSRIEGEPQLPAPAISSGDNTDDYAPSRYWHGVLSRSVIDGLGDWLKGNRINAGITDVLFLIAHRALKVERQPLPLAVIQSCRNLVPPAMRRQIGNLSVYSQIDSARLPSATIPHEWLAALCIQRRNAAAKEKWCQQQRFVRKLNQSMRHYQDLDVIRRFLHQLMRGNQFSVNNYGDFASYFITHPASEAVLDSILDIDIQDASPTQEMRLLSVRGSTFVNICLHADTLPAGGDCAVWFYEGIDKILKHPRAESA